MPRIKGPNGVPFNVTDALADALLKSRDYALVEDEKAAETTEKKPASKRAASAK